MRIFDVPGTLSGDILRLRRNLPYMTGYFEIDGDKIRPLGHFLEYPAVEEDDSEDVSELVSKIPLVDVDPAKHFVNRGKYRSKIENLTSCQGGSIPGHPLSSHIAQLLGKSANGDLVFEKLSPSAYILSRFSSLALYKRWILQLIDTLECLHSLGIVHRGLRIDELVFANNSKRLVVCDLESHWGEREALEVAFWGGLDDSGWTTKSDIFDLGNCIKGMVYAIIQSHVLSNGLFHLRSRPLWKYVCVQSRQSVLVWQTCVS